MKKLAIFFMSVAVLAFGGCSDLEQIDQEQGSITAIMEGSDTRTSVTDEGAFTWSEGDRIWLPTTNGSIVGTLSDGEGSPNANFSYGAIIGGTLTGKAIYPYNAGHAADDDAVAVVLPASYELGSSLNNTNAAMYGVNSNGTIKFNHLAGVMRFSFKNVPAGVDRFAITLDKKINGTFEANLAADYPVLETIATDVEAEKTVELNFDSLAETSDINLYVPLPLGTYTTLGLELFKGETSVWTYSNTVTNTVNRKSLKLMPTVTLGGSIGGEIEGVEVPNNQIWYTASEKVEPYNLRGINQELVIESHTYDPTTQKGVITFTGRLEEIPDEFFLGKSAVTSISLPNVVIIGQEAFAGCSLISVTIPKEVYIIFPNAFYSTSLKEVNILSEQLYDNYMLDAFNTAVLEKITGPLASADGRFLINKGMLVTTALSGVSELIIPEGVTSIGCKCIGNELRKVTIPSSVKVFKSLCFRDNPVLSEVDINSESMEGDSELQNPFLYCPNLTKFTGPLATDDGRFLVQNKTLIATAPYGLSGLVIPEGVEIIGMYSANELNITDITLPSTLTAIHALGGENLETLTCLSPEPPAGRDYISFSKEYKIYVPAESLEKYKSKWNIYADHIFPDEGNYVDEYGKNHGPGIKIGETVWAPVNCGYHETDFKYGKLYQWGRKYGQGYSGDMYVNGTTNGEYSDGILPTIETGQVTAITANNENNSNIYYWVNYNTDWSLSYDTNHWNSGTDRPTKTKYDPCPDGWRVPIIDEMVELLRNASSEYTPLSHNDINGQSGYWFGNVESSKVFLPAAGSRAGNACGGRGLVGRYWSSSIYNTTYSSLLDLGDGYSDIQYNAYRIEGCSVRCVKE